MFMKCVLVISGVEVACGGFGLSLVGGGFGLSLVVVDPSLQLSSRWYC